MRSYVQLKENNGKFKSFYIIMFLYSDIRERFFGRVPNGFDDFNGNQIVKIVKK